MRLRAPARRGPYTNWETRKTDWDEVFSSIQRVGFNQTQLNTTIPMTTLRRRFRLFKQKNTRAFHPAYHLRGRHFTDDEEQLILQSMKEEKRMFNSKELKPIALTVSNLIHQFDSRAQSTRSHHQPRQFKATTRFQMRFRRRHRMRTTPPRISRAGLTRLSATKLEENETKAIEFVYDARHAVSVFGPSLVINADEISAKSAKVTEKAWVPIGQQRPRTNSRFDQRQAWSLMFATTADGRKLPPAVYATSRSLTAADRLALRDICVIIDSPRGVSNGNVHCSWIEQVVLPFVDGQPAALIVDSAPGHNPQKCVTFAEEWGVATLRVPEHRTSELQPMDVGVYAPLSKKAGHQFLQDYSSLVPFHDSAANCIKRYINAFNSTTRHTIRKAWRDSLLPPKSHSSLEI
jgi:hypothetical protein